LICLNSDVGVWKCFDEKLDSCTIQAYSQAEKTSGVTIQKSYCITLADHCFVSQDDEPAITTGIFGEIYPAACVNCIEAPNRIDSNAGELSVPKYGCCSGQKVGDYCMQGGGGTTTTSNFSQVKSTATTTNHLVEGVALDDVSGLTSDDLLKYACTSNDDCKDNSCKSYDWLKANKYMTETQESLFFDKYAQTAVKVSSYIAGGVTGLSTSVIGCAILTAVVIPIPLIDTIAAPLVWTGCTALTAVPLTAGGVAIGGTIGEGTAKLMQKVGQRDTKDLGVCIAGGGTGDFCSFFDFLKPVLAPANAQDKSCTIGAVLAFVVLLIILRGFTGGGR
jgi:hypothetical protein